MKRFILLVAVLGGVSRRAPAAECIPMKWSEYVALTTNGQVCTNGGFQVSNFTFADFNTGFDPANIFATPLPGPNLGFMFALTGFQVNAANQSMNLGIGFTITDPTGKAPFFSETLMLGGTNIANGMVTIQDTQNGLSVARDLVPPERSTDTKSFNPLMTTVKFDGTLNVSTGMNGGAAQIQDFTITFTAVPEPSGLLLLISGVIPVLALCGWIKGTKTRTVGDEAG